MLTRKRAWIPLEEALQGASDIIAEEITDERGPPEDPPGSGGDKAAR